MAVPPVSSATVSFVSHGRRGTLWCSNMFHHVSRVVLCGRRKIFASFWKNEWQFSGRRGALETSIIMLRGMRSTLGVSRCAFVFGIPLSDFKWWQRANCVAGVAFSDMWWKLAEASHETPILKSLILGFVIGKLVGKRRFCSCKLKNWGVSHETLLLRLQHVSCQVSSFPVASLCLWGSCKVSLHALHFTLPTLNFKLYTPHSALHALHSTLHALNYNTPRFKLFTPHCTLYTLHFTLYTTSTL